MIALLLTTALAQTPPPAELPPSVMAEVRSLEAQFERAVASDCHPRLCAPKGCSYISHLQTPPSTRRTLPGLGKAPEPTVASQGYLTEAVCTFGWEQGARSDDMARLASRLESRLSRGWLTVTVTHDSLPPVPAYLAEPEPEPEPEPEVPAIAPPGPPEPLTAESVGRQLWETLLPHTAWMVGVFLLTIAALVVIWGMRRVGRDDAEEALLAELAEAEDADVVPEVYAEPVDEALVQAEQVWRERLSLTSPPDPAVRALLGSLLRRRDLPMLARAALTFPRELPRLFPQGGEVASAKHDLAYYIQTVDERTLPSESELFRALDRHAISAALVTQSDTAAIARLQDDFGAVGLADHLDALSPRLAGLLFAASSPAMQWELRRLLHPTRIARMSEMLMYSNRMDPAEAEALFAAARGGAPMPARDVPVTDRGAPFAAADALSVLLEGMAPDHRDAVYARVVEHFRGRLPSWHHDVFFSDLLLTLPGHERSDLLLSVDVSALAAWLEHVDASDRLMLLDGAPHALVSALRATVLPTAPELVAHLERQARTALSRAFLTGLAARHTAFERVVATPAAEVA